MVITEEELEKKLADESFHEKKVYEEKCVRNLLMTAAMFATIIIGIIMILSLSGCQYIPEMSKAMEEIATDDAINLTVSREALQKETDLHVAIDVVNREIAH